MFNVPQPPSSPKLPRLEYPPLGKPYLLGFDQDNTSFPIVGVHLDPRVGLGQTAPALGSACPYATYSSLVFVRQTTVEEGTRVMRQYQIVPGPTMSGSAQTGDGLAVSTSIQTTLTGGSAPTGFYIRESEVIPTNDYLQQEKVTSTATYQPQPGQEYERSLDLIFPFTQKTVQYGTDAGQAQTQLEPLDYERCREREYNISAIRAAMLAYKRGFPGIADIKVPPVLQSITVLEAQGDGSGTGSASASADSSGSGAPNWSVALDLPNSSEASADFSYELIPNLKYAYGEGRDVVDYFFFLTGPVVSRATAQASLSTLYGLTVNQWPQFQVKEINLWVNNFSGRVRVEASAKVSADYWQNAESTGDSTGSGTSTSQDYSLNNSYRIYTIQNCICGNISSSNSGSYSLSASTSSAITGTGGVPSASTGTITQSVSLTPSANISISATPITDWPSSGLYLMGLDCEASDFGMILCRARVFDFSNPL
jgi:hypothetical protein